MPRLRTLWWSLGSALLALITALSLLPIRGPDLGLANTDKLEHALAYVVLMLYFGQLLGPSLRRRVFVAGALLGYGIAIELLQSMLPPRSAEFADLVADVFGIGIGWLLLPTALGQILLALERRYTRA